MTGPQTMLDRETALKTSTINLDALDRSTTFQVHLNLNEALLKLIGETVIEANIVLKETMVRKTVRGIPINVRDSSQAVKTIPPTVAVEADIPEQIVQITPELSMLFRAAVNVPADIPGGEVPVLAYLERNGGGGAGRADGWIVWMQGSCVCLTCADLLC